MSPSTNRRILLVNPNTNAATTEMMRKLAVAHISMANIEIVGATVPYGPTIIIDSAALAEPDTYVYDLVQERLRESEDQGGPIIAVLVAAIGDPGRRRLAEAQEVPVIGIGQASIMCAGQGGKRFSMATSTPLLAESLASLVDEHSFSEQFTGIRLTDSLPLELAANPEQQYLCAVQLYSEHDEAEAVVIAGGPLSDTARRLASATTVEIIEPIPAHTVLYAPWFTIPTSREVKTGIRSIPSMRGPGSCQADLRCYGTPTAPVEMVRPPHRRLDRSREIGSGCEG